MGCCGKCPAPSPGDAVCGPVRVCGVAGEGTLHRQFSVRGRSGSHRFNPLGFLLCGLDERWDPSRSRPKTFRGSEDAGVSLRTGGEIKANVCFLTAHGETRNVGRMSCELGKSRAGAIYKKPVLCFAFLRLLSVRRTLHTSVESVEEGEGS